MGLEGNGRILFYGWFLRWKNRPKNESMIRELKLDLTGVTAAKNPFSNLNHILVHLSISPYTYTITIFRPLYLFYTLYAYTPLHLYPHTTNLNQP